MSKPRKNISRERLLEILNYDAESGALTWKFTRQGVRGGAIAGTIQPSGYRTVRIDGADYPAHQIVWFLVKGEWPKLMIRFQNDDKTDLRIENLRDGYKETSKFRWGTKEGKRAARRDYYAKNRDRTREWAFRTTFGIDMAEYQRLLSVQDHVCAICGKPETALRRGKVRWLAVDHCHDTGKVRGLLCGKCNPMIGYADHNVEILTRAIDYLKRTNGGTP